MAKSVIQVNRGARQVFEELSAVVTRLQTGETQPRTVVFGNGGHVLLGIENTPPSERKATVEAVRDLSALLNAER